MKKLAIIFAALTLGACGGEVTDNTNTKQANRPNVKTFNSQPLDKDGKPIPGIPDPKQANISNSKPGATPTPGIPEANKADITNQKGATPTPGIPDEATRKRMIEELKKNPNIVNTAPGKPSGASKKPGPINRPRKAN
ncbi:MAG: hypothetical protein HKN33_15435 [Pyrinomonadaceae bacterium]|nr:hypothetical protein [Pyrinomonadaceae bacterium]